MMINKLKENKKLVTLIGCGVLVVAVIVILLFLFVFNSNKSALTKELNKAGVNFYENFYYNQVGNDDNERKEFLSKYAAVGIKIDLENLARTTDNKDEFINKFVNKKTKEKCNINNTKITIYPKEPYGQKDYKMDVVLDCGFEK